jgi:glycosyltransferase involved in cell wall biosynthesis
MKILMSAFACSPVRGSEEGVGWNWAVAAAEQGHEVTVLTQTCDQTDIVKALAVGDVPPGLTFDFLMPNWLARFRAATLKIGLRGLSDHLTHLLWQFSAYNYVRKSYSEDEFEVIHHITYGGIRHPTLLGLIGTPLVLGPLGGGDRIPFSLRRRFGRLSWIRELVRDVHTWSLRFDPITLHACSKASVIYVKTAASRQVLPRRFRDKTAVRMEIGTHNVLPAVPGRERKDGVLRLMYAGRFLDLKGMRIGLKALAVARSRGVNARLALVGPGGPDEANWRQLAKNYGIDDAVEWRGWLSNSELDQSYQDHDALLFPSLRDSSGNVVLESLARGLPVLCLDLGGPAELANDGCGRVVSVDEPTNEICADRLASAIEELAFSASLRRQLSAGALKRARDYLWPDVVAGFYADVQYRLHKQSSKGKAPSVTTRNGRKSGTIRVPRNMDGGSGVARS